MQPSGAVMIEDQLSQGYDRFYLTNQGTSLFGNELNKTQLQLQLSQGHSNFDENLPRTQMNTTGEMILPKSANSPMVNISYREPGEQRSRDHSLKQQKNDFRNILLDEKVTLDEEFELTKSANQLSHSRMLEQNPSNHSPLFQQRITGNQLSKIQYHTEQITECNSQLGKSEQRVPRDASNENVSQMSKSIGTFENDQKQGYRDNSTGEQKRRARATLRFLSFNQEDPSFIF